LISPWRSVETSARPLHLHLLHLNPQLGTRQVAFHIPWNLGAGRWKEKEMENRKRKLRARALRWF
jgi:hypothetical protein